MIGIALAALAGVGVVYAMSSSSSSNSGASAVTSAQQTAAYNTAQAFDVAANTLGLSATQAQQAYNAGVSAGNLAAYAQQQGWSMSGGTTSPSTSGPGRARLLDHGEWDDELGHVYRCSESGAPVVLDAHGDPWMVEE